MEGIASERRTAASQTLRRGCSVESGPGRQSWLRHFWSGARLPMRLPAGLQGQRAMAINQSPTTKTACWTSTGNKGHRGTVVGVEMLLRTPVGLCKVDVGPADPPRRDPPGRVTRS
jgi:hypothetical protein